MNEYRRVLNVGVLLFGCALQNAMADEIDCGSLENAYGPFDYTNPEHRQRDIPVVERLHFNSDVANLRHGQSSSDVMGDLDYVLRAVPNHPHALYAVAMYQLGGGRPGQFRTAACYFDRALRFKPDDGSVYLVYGIYLHKKKEYELALSQYQRALQLMPKSADAHYNLGLLYFDMKKYPEARAQAQEAARLGHPLQGLHNKLQRIGEWEDTSAGG